eukprot:7390287-Prymnesium_polylepis.1
MSRRVLHGTAATYPRGRPSTAGSASGRLELQLHFLRLWCLFITSAVQRAKQPRQGEGVARIATIGQRAARRRSWQRLCRKHWTQVMHQVPDIIVCSHFEDRLAKVDVQANARRRRACIEVPRERRLPIDTDELPAVIAMTDRRQLL